MRISQAHGRYVRRILVRKITRKALHGTDQILQRVEGLTGHPVCPNVGPCTKVHGLLRTGTNYVSALLARNFPTFVFDSPGAGWKHGPIEWDECTRFVVTIKNPYSWIVSFKNWEGIHERMGQQTSIEDFLKAPVSHEMFASAWNARNPIDAWNKAITSWMSFQGRPNVRVTRYEDLVSDFEAEMDKLTTLYRRRRAAQYSNITKRADDWKTKNPRKKLETNYYIDDGFMGEFSEEALQVIRESIDGDIAKACGYAIV
jgi:hypothetical protein